MYCVTEMKLTFKETVQPIEYQVFALSKLFCMTPFEFNVLSPCYFCTCLIFLNLYIVSVVQIVNMFLSIYAQRDGYFTSWIA